MELDFKEDFKYWSKRLYEKNLAPATSGNISVKINDNTILISKSGVALGDIQNEDILEMDFDCNVKNSNSKPSVEKLLHVMIYEKRDDINAIIHSHAPLLTAFACCNKKITKPFMPDFAYYFNGKIEVAPYFLPGSIKLAEVTSKMFEKSNCVLMANHGIIIGADSLQKCFYNLESLNAYIETYFACEMIGKIKYLTKSQIKEIENF